jgi:chromosome partitioning protein
MHVIVLAAQKGGCGKSSLAIGLAVAAVDAGQRVGMIDADPQGTISNWGRRRTNPKPRIECADSGMAIERAIFHLRGDGFTVAIIDTAATNNSCYWCSRFVPHPGAPESGRYRGRAADTHRRPQAR